MSERFFPDSMPQPLANTVTLPFWEACAEHRLVVQKCNDCGHTQLPPTPLCAECHSESSGWEEISGRGEVYTFTWVHRPIAGGMELPFVVAVISLEGSGGLRMISNVVGADPATLAIGTPVEVVWEDMSEDLAIPRFRPVG